MFALVQSIGVCPTLAFSAFPPSVPGRATVEKMRQSANHIPMSFDGDIMSLEEPKRHFALSREVTENKGIKNAILHLQSRELIENKCSYKNSYQYEMSMTLCHDKDRPRSAILTGKRRSGRVPSHPKTTRLVMPALLA